MKREKTCKNDERTKMRRLGRTHINKTRAATAKKRGGWLESTANLYGKQFWRGNPVRYPTTKPVGHTG